MNKIILSIVVTLTLINSFAIYSLVKVSNQESKAVFGEAVTRYMNVPTTSSTTVFTLTTTSLRLLATTTSPLNRVGALVQTICPVGSRVHMNMNNGVGVSDIVATTATGPIVNATSTDSLAFGVYGLPVNNNSVQGITNNGTCTVIVTEWTALR